MKMRMLWLAAGTFAGGLALQPIGVAQSPGTYRVDPKSSRIEIRVFRAGLLGSLGDNHVIRSSKISGEAIGDQGGGWKIKVHLDSASLRVEDEGISDATRQEIQSTMQGSTQLYVGRYPAIDLVSQSAERGSTPHSFLVKSDLSLHGVTRRVDFPVEVTEAGGGFEVKGKAQLRLRDFNIEPISKGLGSVKVKNEFEVICDIKLLRDKP